MVHGACDEKEKEQEPSRTDGDQACEIDTASEIQENDIAKQERTRQHVRRTEHIIVSGQGDRSKKKHVEDSRKAHRLQQYDSVDELTGGVRIQIAREDISEKLHGFKLAPAQTERTSQNHAAAMILLLTNR